MEISRRFWPCPEDHLRALSPENAVVYFCPDRLAEAARTFAAGFPGLVTYAVKANDRPEVISTLAQAGIRAFDVASPAEMAGVRRTVPGAALHYNNPVRSDYEVRQAMELGVVSYAVDSASELERLLRHLRPDGLEIAVRFKLPVAGAAYDFGTKFGAEPRQAAGLLRRVADAGFLPSLTFHPGTQCPDPRAWRSYIAAAASIADAAGVVLARLNVGGGFAADRGPAGVAETHVPVFEAIAQEARTAFREPPALICEPGRALASEACAVAARVKAVRDDGAVFLNDGIYGQFAEAPLIGLVGRIRVIGPGGARCGALCPRRVFGPTCDSIDRLPGEVPLPEDLAEGDYLLVAGMGAYCEVTSTRFNGYGETENVTVARLSS